MTQDETHIGQVATIMVPVADQDAALTFYVETLGMRKVSDFTYPSGERWLEVSAVEGSANLCLIAARPERPAGIETGVVLFSGDVLADLAALRARGVDTDEHPLPEGRVVWWSGAPLAGVPTQFRLLDPDGNSFLIVDRGVDPEG
jgi:catechol 2,3-dioxygenase-like lactoylglutathione lyase family enzyme